MELLGMLNKILMDENNQYKFDFTDCKYVIELHDLDNKMKYKLKEAKYDLRDWAPGHEKMCKGVTLSVDELKQLKELLISK